MEAYECIIFDMKMMENSEVNTRGSWKHSYQEAILKSKFEITFSVIRFINHTCENCLVSLL